MKIYPLTVSSEIRPNSGFRAPAHNDDFGVEQDFSEWLFNSGYLTAYQSEADWDYFPAYFNRLYCNHWGNRSELLQAEILRCVSRNRPTFTIAEYDLYTYHPDFDFCGMVIFTASRRGDQGIDIPLLCSLHQNRQLSNSRKWLASFMGKFETHGSREEMRQVLQDRPDVYLTESQNTAAYIQLLADSYIALAPRGYGGQTFRFYEAMQFGCVPLLIGDLDTRPFKEYIDWDGCSLYCQNAARLPDMLDALTTAELTRMGQQAQATFYNIHYGKWCKYVIETLKVM